MAQAVAALEMARRTVSARVVRSDLRAAGPDAGGVAGRAAAGAGARGGPSVAVPVDDRAGDRVRGTCTGAARSCCRTVTTRRRCMGDRRGSRAVRLLPTRSRTMPRRARRAGTTSPTGAMRDYAGIGPGAHGRDQPGSARCSPRGATARRKSGRSAWSATGTARPMRPRCRTDRAGARDVVDGAAPGRGHRRGAF